MKESYTREPETIELFQHNGHTDVIIRRNITFRQTDPDEHGNVTDLWECDETQFRYPGPLSRAEVSAQVDNWLLYAGAASLDALDAAKTAAIENMSATCNSAIRAGFDVALSDGKLHHFSLEITDQIMISLLAGKATAGATAVPWHGDGEECRFFSIADISKVNTEMEALITYHQTYFNSLKHYILGMGTVEEVSAAYYGMPIPDAYQSEVLQAILAAGEGGRDVEETV